MKALKLAPIMMFAITIYSCDKAIIKNELKEVNSEVIPVQIEQIDKTNIAVSIQATGLLSTENEVKYAFKIGGVIEKIFVKEGETFKKGQLLATLNSTEIEAQYQRELLNLEKAKRDYIRINNLYLDSVATLEQLQNVRTSAELAEKSLETVRFNKKYARIVALNEGFVTSKYANEGEIIAPSSTVLAINETSSKNSWIVNLGITDKDWKNIEINQKANILIDAFPDKNFSGIVSKKSMSANPLSGTYTVELKILNPNQECAIGMFAKATIDNSLKNNVSIIPFDALIEAEGNKASVFVPIGTKVKRIPVIIESFNNDYVVIKSGLENYDTVVTSNSAFLNENSIIKIVKQ